MDSNKFDFADAEYHDFDPYEEKSDKKRKLIIAAVVGVCVVGLVVGLAVGLTVGQDDDSELIQTTTLPPTTPPPTIPPLEARRIDCLPEGPGRVGDQAQETCSQRGCVWQESDFPQVPSCYLPQDGSYGYSVLEGPTPLADSAAPSGYRWLLNAMSDSIFGNATATISFEYEELSNNILRFTFDDPNSERYKVPLELSLPTGGATDPKYRVEVSSNGTFSFRVIRTATGTVIWDSSVGGLTFSDRFLQIATRLPSHHVYGFGENLHTSFRHDMDFQTWPMFARDEPPGGKKNAYGSHPYYECVEDEEGYTHGVLLYSSNAIEYSFTPSPMLVLRALGGILDFYVFMGSAPEQVSQQYLQTIGLPYMPPYWSLGFQISRFNYENTADMRAAVDRTLQYEIPLDVQHADIDHMEGRRSFTLNISRFGDMPDYFREIGLKGIKNIVILDPCLEVNYTYEPFVNGYEQDIFIKWPSAEVMPPEDFDETNSTIMLGYVWPEYKVAFPDFFLAEAADVWNNEVVKLKDLIPYDSIWIDMNEPANFDTNRGFTWNNPELGWSLMCPESYLDDPPYPTMAATLYDWQNEEEGTSWTGRLSDKTLCMQAIQNKGALRHYDVHNLYGHMHSKVTLEGMREALQDKRGLIISRSMFPGSGHYGGRWLGDNTASWQDLALSIIGMLESNLFGIPYIGADICGFFQNPSPELCMRWHQLGAFYPFSRNHNHEAADPQDPGYFGDSVAIPTRDVLNVRYLMLPHLYTLFHLSHTLGTTVVRPLHHEFPGDVNTFGIDRQFLWGCSLLISPILEEGQTELSYYLPEGRWYDFYTGASVTESGGLMMSRDVDYSSPIGLHVRGGHIIPTQQPANNTMYSRQRPFGALVALDSQDGGAQGHLFWDDGESIDTYESGDYYWATFQAARNEFKMSVEYDNVGGMSDLEFGSLEVMGVSTVTHVYLNDVIHTHFTYNDTTSVLSISDLGHSMSDNLSVRWSSGSQPTVEELERVDCCPEGCFEDVCSQRSCLYQESSVNGIPWCYIDVSTYGYEVVESSTEIPVTSSYVLQTEGTTMLQRKATSGSLYGNDIQNVQMTAEEYNHVYHIKFTDADNSRYEVPVEMNLPAKDESSEDEFSFTFVADPFSFRLSRATGGNALLDTDLGGLTLSERFLQFASRLNCAGLYGIGENEHHTFQHNFDYRNWRMFTRDQPPRNDANLYSVHPFYMCVEEGGKAHGVLILNSNAQEIRLQPLPSLTYRTVGGVLDLYVIVGDHPEQVLQRYHQMIGLPMIPPYWALGFHLSRYGYDHMDKLKEAVDRTIQYNIPYDVQHLDIDTMDERKDFTWDAVNFAGLPEYVDELRNDKNLRVMTILDPFLISNETEYPPFDKGWEQDVFIKWPEGTNPDAEYIHGTDVLVGWSWPKGRVVYPDYFHPNSSGYWSDLIVDFYKDGHRFDGIWLDMNDPANFGTNLDRPWNWPEDELPYWSLKCPQEEDPPYIPAFLDESKQLSDKTVCLSALQKQGEYTHYDTHSLYGWSQTLPTLRGVQNATGTRGWVVSRSTYPSSGKISGHWLGDNASIWPHLRYSIIGMLEFNMFGVPFVGADICGYFNDCPAQLCQRWMQLGAFYTFARNHNGRGYTEQDPGYFGESVASSSRKVLEIRYRLLPYLYTLFYYAHIQGGTVIRPLLNEFPTDGSTYSVDQQFLWGPALMISPVMEENEFGVYVYFPHARWFDYYTGREVERPGETHWAHAALDEIPLHIRGGHVLPTQDPATNTFLSRQNAFGVIVAPDEGNTANGSMFWDDGESADTVEANSYYYATFEYSEGRLSLEVSGMTRLVENHLLNTARIFGVNTRPHTVTAPGTNVKIFYEEQTRELLLEDLEVPMDENYEITWS